MAYLRDGTVELQKLVKDGRKRERQVKQFMYELVLLLYGYLLTVVY